MSEVVPEAKEEESSAWVGTLEMAVIWEGSKVMAADSATEVGLVRAEEEGFGSVVVGLPVALVAWQGVQGFAPNHKLSLCLLSRKSRMHRS